MGIRILGLFLVLVGIIGSVVPWIVHESNGFFSLEPEVQRAASNAYFSAIGASVLALLGSIILLTWKRIDRDHEATLILVLALTSGAVGLGSAVLMMLFSMM